MCSKLTIKTSKRWQWGPSELWTYFTPFSVSVVDFEQVNVSLAKFLEKDIPTTKQHD